MNQRAQQRALAAVATVGLLGGGLFWAFSSGDTLGEMRIRVVSGSVAIQRGDETITSRDETDIAPGDVVTTAEGSRATLRLEGQRVLDLDARARIEIAGPAAVASQEGTVVARAVDPLKVVVGDTVTRGHKSIFRIDRDAGTTRAGVYAGQVDLTAPGSPNLHLDALWQTTFVADRLYGAEPYRLRAGDEWDGQYLNTLIDLDQALETKRAGYIPQIAGTSPTIDYFASLVKQDVGFLRPYADDLSPKKPGYTADVMIGLFIAKHASGPLAKSFDEGFGYYRQGATWGVSAGLLGMDADKDWKPAVAELDVAFYGSSGVGGGSSEGPTFAVAGEEDPGDGGTVDGAPDGTDPGNDPGDTTDDPAPPPPGDGDGDDGDGDGDGDDGDGDGDDDPSPPPCDVQCEVEKVLEPTPDPNEILDPPPLGR